WIYSLTGYIKRMVQVLRFAVPVVGPWIGILAQDHYKDIFENDKELMVQLVERLPEAKETGRGGADESRQMTPSEYGDGGPSLRAVRKLLEEKDPRRTWGGLKRTLTPEGHYLWLCQYHVAEYNQ